MFVLELLTLEARILPEWNKMLSAMVVVKECIDSVSYSYEPNWLMMSYLAFTLQPATPALVTINEQPIILPCKL